MSNNPVRLQSGDGIAITQTSNALDVNIKSGLPTGAATEQGLDDILAKLSADPATQTTLAAILAKIIVAPASEAKQDTGNASLASIKTAVEGATPAGTNIIGKVGIDQATANANEVVIKSKTAETYLGKDRTTTTGAAEELTIPANSKRVILSCAPSSQVYIELNADATTGSPLYFEDPFGPITLDLGSVTKLSAWVVAGNLGAVFFG